MLRAYELLMELASKAPSSSRMCCGRNESSGREPIRGKACSRSLRSISIWLDSADACPRNHFVA
ncbi:hypothetical protein GCM10010272_57910 [Streptomyces lateritius]|nr:hypothetical protein GCM10010272_57910 [Streptomyces lateritius]